MPINYSRYPKNWKELREEVLERAKDKCEFCGVRNGSIGYRDNGKFVEVENSIELDSDFCDNIKFIKIVLTIAHLDHDEENHDVKIERLAALCQRCHLVYDIDEKRRRRKNKKAVERLFNGNT